MILQQMRVRIVSKTPVYRASLGEVRMLVQALLVPRMGDARKKERKKNQKLPGAVFLIPDDGAGSRIQGLLLSFPFW